MPNTKEIFDTPTNNTNLSFFFLIRRTCGHNMLSSINN